MRVSSSQPFARRRAAYQMRIRAATLATILDSTRFVSSDVDPVHNELQSSMPRSVEFVPSSLFDRNVNITMIILARGGVDSLIETSMIRVRFYRIERGRVGRVSLYRGI